MIGRARRPVASVAALCLAALATPVRGHAQWEPGDPVAYSLGAARRALFGDSADPLTARLGGITEVWGIVRDDSGDLIVVGSSRPDRPGLSVDDLIVAIRTAGSVATGENPGVSIEPPEQHRYSPTQDVIYYGGIEGTRYGRVCFEADLLLKALGMGMGGGLGGLFPSSWELAVDNAKAGRVSDPWVGASGRSWFFPTRVSISRTDGAVALAAATMAVQSQRDGAVELPDHIDPTARVLREILDRDPAAADALFARLFTQHYDELADRYPVLHDLRSLLSLSGLVAELMTEEELDALVTGWGFYEPVPVDTPESIPTLSRAHVDAGAQLYHAGGVSVEYALLDPWVDAVLARKPRYLREAALAARPQEARVAWPIPLSAGDAGRWTDDVLAAAERAFLGREPPPPRDDAMPDPTPSAPPDRSWNPRTTGGRMLGLSANLELASGGREYWSRDRRYSVSGADVSVAAPLTATLLLSPRVKLAASLPLLIRLDLADESELLGLSDREWDAVMGTGDPTVELSALVATGVRGGRPILPQVRLESAVTLPAAWTLFRASGERDGSGQRTEASRAVFSHAAEAQLRIGSYGWVTTLVELQTDWDTGTPGDLTVWGGGVQLLVEPELGLAVGGQLLGSRRRGDLGVFEPWGRMYSGTLSYQTRTGANTLRLGIFAPAAEGGGTFFASFSLQGLRLFDERVWY